MINLIMCLSLSYFSTVLLKINCHQKEKLNNVQKTMEQNMNYSDILTCYIKYFYSVLFCSFIPNFINLLKQLNQILPAVVTNSSFTFTRKHVTRKKTKFLNLYQNLFAKSSMPSDFIFTPSGLSWSSSHVFQCLWN